MRINRCMHCAARALLIVSLASSVALAQDQQAEVSARPTLTEAELRELLSYSDFAIDPRNGEVDRLSKAQLLGKRFHHPYCIPPLLAVLRNKNEPHHLRQMCLYSLSAINDHRVVDYLVEFIPEEILGRQSNEQLRKITGVSVGSFNPMKPDPGGAFRRALQNKWRKWWSDNRERTKLTSENAFDSAAVFYKEVDVDD